MLLRGGKLRHYILVKRPSEGDIDRLCAAADPKYRQISLKSKGDRFQFGKGSLRVDLAELGDGLLAIISGINIKTAAANE